MQEHLREASPGSQRRSGSSSRSNRSRRSQPQVADNLGVHHLRDVKSSFEPLQKLANDLGTPLACLRLDRHGATDRKTFFDSRNLPPASSPSSSPPSAALLPPTLSSILNSSAESTETAPSDIDEQGGNTVFAVGSLVKVFINLVFCVLICQEKLPGLTWETKVFELYNSICDRNGEPSIPRLERDPTLLELLLHRYSFAPMNRFLLAPDGTFLPTSSEFLQYAAPFSDHFSRTQKPKPFNYSNANHIFAAFLLEKIVGLSFSEIMNRKLFAPLKMLRTAVDRETLDAFKEGNMAQGYRVTINLSEFTPTTNDYLEDTAQAAFLGARSCTNDIAGMFQELFAAVDGKSQVLSQETVQYFFGTYSQLSHINHTLAGTYCTLESGAVGSESLNVHSRPPETPVRPTLGTRAKKSIFVFYKAGVADGFTCCLYVSVLHKTSLVILSNSTGPVDFCDYASRYILQEVFDTLPPIDVIGEAREDLQLATKFLASLYEQSEEQAGSDRADSFVGDFEHVVHKQKLSINSSRNVVLGGSTNHSSAFRAVISGSLLRIVLKENEATVDHRYEWKDCAFELSKKLGKYYLVGAGGTDYYEKI